MNWLLWRQHRGQVFVTLVGTGLFAVAVVLTGVHMAHIYKNSLATCTANGTCNLVGNLFSGYGAIIDLVHLSIALPVMLGTFVGATLVAREREHATNVLVWTQTVTRRRWLYSKIAAVLAGTVIASAVVSALVTWWSNTPNALDGNRFEGAQFDTQNVLPIALAIFAVALGIAAGCILRRTLPALATTVGVYVGVRLLVAVYLRPHYLKPIDAFVPVERGFQSPVGVMDYEGASRRRRRQGDERPDPGSHLLWPDREQARRGELPRSARLPPGGDLPTAEPLLALPMDRVRDLRRAGGRTHHGRGRLHPAS